MRKKFKIFYLIIVFVSLSINLFAKDNFYLLPQDADDALRAIVHNIDTSKKNIKLSIYSFTHKQIAKKIKNAAKRGVKVEIIFDKHQNRKKNKFAMLGYLAKYKNITIYKLHGKLSKNKKYHGIMHIKMALIDDKTVIFGSANWTKSAFSTNYETLFITQNYAIGKKYSKFFEKMKRESKIFK